MTKTAILAAVAATLAAGAVTPALADRVDQRQYNQQNRIERGVATGKLTPGEAARLEREQANIRASERAFKDDGRLSPRERAILEAKQDRASRDIYAEKHDRNFRGHHRWWNRYYGWGYGHDHSYGPRRWW